MARLRPAERSGSWDARPRRRPGPAPTRAVPSGFWITPTELAALPMSGSPWSLVAAQSNPGVLADVSDQNSTHDTKTMGCALYAARSGNATARTNALAALTAAIGTETGTRWLSVGRNMTAYIIAADVLGIRSGPIYDWIASFKTKLLMHDNTSDMIPLRSAAWSAGSNANAQEGAVHAAMACYTGDRAELDWGWVAFRRYLGDRTSTHAPFTSNDDTWQEVPAYPVGIQNQGATASGILIDGAISNDVSRGGTLAWPPVWSQYPWVGLEGAVPAAHIYARAGYPAWTMMNSALRRAADFLIRAKDDSGDDAWYDTTRAPEIKHMLNKVYGLGYPEGPCIATSRTVSYTDWTMP